MTEDTLILLFVCCQPYTSGPSPTAMACIAEEAVRHETVQPQRLGMVTLF